MAHVGAGLAVVDRAVRVTRQENFRVTNEPSRETSTWDSSSKRILIGFAAGCVICLAFVVPVEVTRWNELTGEPGTAWLFDMNIDTTPYAVLFILLPVMWLIRQPLMARPPKLWTTLLTWLGESPRTSPQASRFSVVFAALFVAFVAAVSCLRVASTPVTVDGVAFGALPPAYHDEYSYLFQAQTFAEGRLTFPSHPTAARMFDQMHVLNEGNFASRYFPGNGLWITPFVLLGNPMAASWLATVVVCVFVFLIGRELSCNGVGLLASLLAALSPGLVLFGNTLLAHQATLVWLGLFICSFLKMRRLLGQSADDPSSGRAISIAVPAALSGIGLSFAMLCRPMTAAGVGLPFGVWLAWWLFRNARLDRQVALRVVAGFVIPLSIGFVVAGVYNVNTTGSVLKTPYHLYTELFTPRHMFGFNNVERAKPLTTDRTLHNYDQWAENLDAELAIQNVQNRFLASWQWTLGLVAVVLLGTVFLAGTHRNLDKRWWLIAAAILTLHAAHVPYWYDGIFHWHYVFESGILWCLVAAAAVQLLVRQFSADERPWMTAWVGLLIAASVATNNVAVPPFQSVSRLDAGISQLAFSRVRFFSFRQLLSSQVQDLPALVLVRHDPADLHIDYVTNHPSLTSPLLIGRLPADARTSEEDTVQLTTETFPDRSLFVFDAATSRLTRIR